VLNLCDLLERSGPGELSLEYPDRSGRGYGWYEDDLESSRRYVLETRFSS